MSGLLSAQGPAYSNTVGCGTRMPVKNSGLRNNVSTLFNLVNSLKHDTCLNKKFSVVFYLIADSNKQVSGIGPADLNNFITQLNNVFEKICVSFMNCSTQVIQNHTFNDWIPVKADTTVAPNFFTANTINVYLPASIQGNMQGYTYPPGFNPYNLIVFEKSLLSSPGINPIIMHEMGHFFGLVHTFDEIGQPVSPGPPPGVQSYEYVDRSNCPTNGDGFCDTEADCFPIAPVVRDGHNDYYVLPTDNFMSYYTGRCRFSQEQYNYMARVILTQLLFLN